MIGVIGAEDKRFNMLPWSSNSHLPFVGESFIGRRAADPQLLHACVERAGIQAESLAWCCVDRLKSLR